MRELGSAASTITTQCCIAGGGPAGMMAGFLLARAGIDIVILEKHADFLRDFRGDTIHPSTLELMYELGLLDDFLARPHQELREIGGQIGDHEVKIADFSHLPVHCKFIGLMPQWDFLKFLAEKGKRYPRFHLRMQSEVAGLIEESGQIMGVRAKTPDGTLEVRADLTIGADGRHSTVREKAKLEVINIGAPIDVLWMRLPREPRDPFQTLGRFLEGKILVAIDRGDYWQCAFVIPKGAFDQIKQKGLPAFRDEIATVAPFLRERTGELKDWDDIKLLTVMVDRLHHWFRPGLLCIGDSAHAMSPVGGVGINLAIQDAVAAANILCAHLARGQVASNSLAKVQKRREFPTRMTQGLQVLAHKRILYPTLTRKTPSTASSRLPILLRLLQQWPALRRIPARALGLGFRPEHIHTPEAKH